MPPLSKMKRLPPEVREEVHRLFADGVTIEQVTAHLRELGHQVTLGGVGRYRRYWAERIQPALDFRAFVAEQLPSLADQSENRLGLLNLELLQQKLNQALVKLDAEALDAEALVKLLVKVGMAQGMVSRSRREEIMAALRLEDLKAVLEATEGDLLEKRDGRLVRVEFVEASTAKALPEGEAGPKKARRASGKASTQKDKDAAQ